MEGRLGWFHKTLATRRAKRGSVKVNKEGLRTSNEGHSRAETDSNMKPIYSHLPAAFAIGTT